MCIELKTPQGNGILSEKQNSTLKKYKLNGYKCIVPSDYDPIHREIDDYFLDVRIKCQYCNRLFKTDKTLDTHHKYIHRIKYNV